MIVRWPGVIAAGSITPVFAHVVDLMPTFVSLAGAERGNARELVPQPLMEGRSLLPLFRGEAPGPYPVPLGWELHGSCALRDGDWKLIWDAGMKTWELYNLAEDRTETNDVAAQHPDRVEAMAAQWKKWADHTGAPVR